VCLRVRVLVSVTNMGSGSERNEPVTRCKTPGRLFSVSEDVSVLLNVDLIF
jgi:hypothetical protein